ncbi:MAG: FAD-dependent oxidoreductase [Candidatus Eremiobacteraeota bacterium]|nr:FAD-dependent oxidoreductase [Candidatus Eremiobacteraeota bacterium]
MAQVAAARCGVAVIGAGVVGAAIAHELSGYGVDVIVLEREAGPARGASGSNAGIIHTGFEMTAGSFEADMLLANAGRWQPLFDELQVPYRVCGALMLAHSFSENAQLTNITENAERNGVKVRQLDRGQARNMQPHARAFGGLLVPGEAITDPFELVWRLLHGAGEVRYGVRVERVESHEHGSVLHTDAGTLSARFTINCAGLFADDIAKEDSVRIMARRGEFIVYPPTTGPLCDHILLPLPGSAAQSIRIVPTLYGHLCAGPIEADQADKTECRMQADRIANVQRKAEKIIPRLADFPMVGSWAGLASVGQPRDYIVEWSKRVPAMFHVAGIRSTGLSTCFGLSAYVVDRLRERGLAMGSRRATAKPPAAESQPWWQRPRA